MKSASMSCGTISSSPMYVRRTPKEEETAEREKFIFEEIMAPKYPNCMNYKPTDRSLTLIGRQYDCPPKNSRQHNERYKKLLFQVQQTEITTNLVVVVQSSVILMSPCSGVDFSILDWLPI